MLTFYHAPRSRSSGIHWLLEELGAPYRIEIVDIRAEGGAPESYRAIHPHKKVPAIDHDDMVITERAAITTYLADAFPGKGLAPAIGDRLRGPYLTWLVYADAVMDPVLAAKVEGWTYAPSDFSFGSFEDMLAHVERMLSKNPYVLGNRFTAADIPVAGTLFWGLNVFGLVPSRPVFLDYLARIEERPAFLRTIVQPPLEELIA
ncbi:glutathione S-transferase family protein [Microvirga makkahensis]|uniref:Glutathione S-transferase n=1 Tax=Microvirga makkahensis TaxID=1128670 RepID=A0A7X3MUP8_9HYPH|nr:glutathione S-transferase family protein [Microvirga makkahensis]MXQ13598.1 glutathione S-transferase [Microvirga makkahensis]